VRSSTESSGGADRCFGWAAATKNGAFGAKQLWFQVVWGNPAVFGIKHRTLTDWLKDDWWSKGPPVCVISGFPGSGKTEIAVQAMNALKQARPELPIAFFNCIASKSNQADDLLLTITEELAADGDREPLEQLERGEDVAAIFSRILAPLRLIVADEAQRLLIGSTGSMPKATASYLERWSQTVGSRGRLLLLTSREFDVAHWTGQVKSFRIDPLEPNEAEAFLRVSLDETGRTEAVPQERITDVVTWLGCNPRAIKLLVSALAREPLDDLIGLATEAWEARDRAVSPELLREFEEVILTRAEERLDSQARIFLSRLSVLRQPADGRALEALRPQGTEFGSLRDELVARFMLELRRNWYGMHPVLRDTVRARMTDVERRRAHLAAGRYYAAPFRAQRALGTPEKLGARFIESRYHFTLAESQIDLDDISARFEAHYRTQFGLTTAVPTDGEELDERIALLSALLQARGAKGLEYHLARCLVRRNRPGDPGRALSHASRATGPQSPADAWVLRLQLEASELGPGEATKVTREALASLPVEQAQPVYQVAAEILARDGKPGEALELLRQGIKEVRPEYNLYSLYQLAGGILARDGKPGEALELLRQGIKEVRPEHNLYFLYQLAGGILARDGKPGEAVDWLLQGAASLPPGRGGYRLKEQAIFHALAENLLDTLPIGAFDSSHADLLAISSALAQDDPERAAQLGAKALVQAGPNMAIFAQTAFAWLSAGDPAKADETLRKFPRPRPDDAGSSLTWLRAFVKLELGATDEASLLLDIYTGGRADAKNEVDRSLLLRLWDNSHSAAAFHFPRLTPRLTGLTRTIVRHQYDGPVLTEEDLQATGEPRRGPPAEATERAVSSFDPTRVLIAMRPDRWHGLYVLGCYDKTKTVYVQQCRALTLIHALFEAEELRPGSRLGIVGGGAAGVTAAAAAARKGAKVILFERARHLLPLQRQNTKRYLHPHLYDWPAPGSINARAELPLLDWRADWSNAVATEIVVGFEEVVATTGNVDLRLGVGIQDVAQVPSADETRRIQILAAEGEINEIVDVAIVAVGFGFERRNRLGIDSRPYWEDDGLEQALGASPEHPQRILVSGAGDGALIDLLRASIRDFRHEHIVALLPEDDALRKLQDELQAIESKTKQTSLIRDASFINLQQMYGTLALPAVFLDQVRSRIRDDTEVWFNFDSAGRYTLGSAILNRFLVSVLSRLEAIKPKLATLDEKSVMRRPGGEYAITWPKSTEPQIFDRVVIRHGPPVDYLAEVFPELQVACAPLRGQLRNLDLTGALDGATRTYFAR
jgi:tetratricopeptide (TPR) repeat protein